MAIPVHTSDLPELAPWLRGRRRSLLREMVSVASKPGIVSLAGGLPAPELFPARELAAALAHVLSADPGALQYGPPFEPLKEQIAALMAERGVRCSTSRILLTAGAQQGIGIAAALLLRPGGQVIMEEATYGGAVEAVARFTPEMLTVPTDLRFGIDVDAVERVLAAGARPAFVYVIPDGHNPCGVSMSRPRRERLVEVARRYRVPILEDGAYGLLQYGPGSEPPLAALDEEWVIAVGTFSKILAPALRLGWMVLPAEVAGPALIAKEAGDLECSALTQRAVAQYLGTGALPAHVEALRAAYRVRRDALLEALDRWFPRSARWTRPAGGFFVWVELPRQVDCAALLREALRDAGVAFVPGRAFSEDGDGVSHCLRLSFATCRPDQLETGVRRLAALIERRLAHA